jgi:phage gp46-like protein
MTFTGDVLIREINGDFDAEWQNGQPIMTDGFETAVLLAIYGDRRTWQNAIAVTPEERFISTFPDIIARARVNEKTKNDGTAALQTALAFLVSSRAASRVTVTGQILSVYAIGWAIDIDAPNGNGGRFEINWERGVLTTGYRRAA